MLRPLPLLPLLVGLLVGLFADVSFAADPPIPADTEIQTTPSGLKYSVLAPGSGEGAPKLGDRVRVHYTGWLLDGKVFDSSHKRGKPAEFVIGEVVPGWNEALPMMTKGARWKLTIPPDLGYGKHGSPGVIPPDATLVFEVELLDVVARMPVFRAGVPEAQKKTESGLVYEVLREGAGDPPRAEDGFELRFALWTADGKLLDATERAGRTLEGKAANFSLPFLGEAVRLLRPGSRVRFEVPPQLAFGARRPPEIAPDAKVVWELELVRVNRPLPVPAFALSAPGKATKTPSGLEIETLAEGSGASPKLGEVVVVHYAGWLTDGTLFDDSYSRGAPTKFRLGEVIPGWNQGLQTMKVGGKARLTIPPDLAYGPGGKGQIPPNATLIFVVELVAVNP